MLLALGAVSSALEALQSLTSKSSATKTGPGTANAASFDFTGSAAAPGSAAPASGSGGSSQLAPQTLSALIAAQGQSGSSASASTTRSGALQDLFSLIHSGQDGNISKTEFEQALGAGGTNLAQADDVFNKLDANGDGSVSLDELSKALKGTGRHHHHHAAGAAGADNGSNTDPLLQALAGASGNSVSNSDGSTTTSLSYADGSKVTLTTPAASSTSGSASKSYNLVEQLIQREAQAISTNASLSLSA
jgi:hypothetical protein